MLINTMRTENKKRGKTAENVLQSQIKDHSSMKKENVLQKGSKKFQ